MVMYKIDRRGGRGGRGGSKNRSLGRTRISSAAAYIMTDSGPGAVATCPNTYTSDCQRHVPNLIRSTKETTDAFS